LTLTPYIPGKHIKTVEAELGITGMIKMASNENPLGPSPKAIEAAAEAMREGNFYPDPHCTYLREALSEHLGIGQDHLVFGNGAHEMIFYLASTFMKPGEEAVIPQPSFGEFNSAVKLAGGTVKSVPVVDFKLDLEGCLQAVTEKTKLMFICNPNNPTGTIVDKQELKSFIDRVPGHVLVIYDEAYRQYIDDPDYPEGVDWVKQGKNVIVLRTFSKAYALAGLRVGYAVAKPELAAYISRVRQVFNVNTVAQAAAVASLKDSEYINKGIELNRRSREYLYQALTEMKVEYVPSQANFFLVDVKGDGNRVFQELMLEGVIVRPASIFGLPSYLRVSFGTLEQNKKFIAALGKVLAKLNLNK